MPRGLKKAFDIFSTIVVILVVALTVLLVGARLVGLQVFAVLSGSMEPDYPVGSLIYVKEVEPHELVAGDVITYMISEDTVVTHQVMGVVPDDEDPNIWRFRTKGIANEMEDATLVHEANILGSPVFTIPYLGYVADYIQNPPGTYYAIAIGALVLMVMFIPDLLEDDEAEKEKKAKKQKGKKQKAAEPAPEATKSAPETAAPAAQIPVVSAPPAPLAPAAEPEQMEDIDLFLAEIKSMLKDQSGQREK